MYAGVLLCCLLKALLAVERGSSSSSSTVLFPKTKKSFIILFSYFLLTILLFETNQNNTIAFTTQYINESINELHTTTIIIATQLQVKTTQPRRYLVRPNQGLIAPGKKETVTILLVEKDKNSLLASFESLGPAALAHCKDKFLVQSVAVSPSQAETLVEYEALTALWGRMQGNNNNANSSNTANKKLHVKHHVVVADDGTGGTTTTAPTTIATVAHPEKLPKDQLVVELQNLRRKYDELVAFSVNLTAERDVLNNTLEQTKRDLNRELAQKENKGPGGNQNRGGGGAAQQPAHPMGSGAGTVLIYVVLALLLGAKLHQMGLLQNVPGFAHAHAHNSNNNGSSPGYDEL